MKWTKTLKCFFGWHLFNWYPKSASGNYEQHCIHCGKKKKNMFLLS